jgi:hypothetical protein
MFDNHFAINSKTSVMSFFVSLYVCCRFCLNFLKTKQCDQSRDARKLETEKLWKQLSSTVSRGTLPPGEIQETISYCLYHHNPKKSFNFVDTKGVIKPKNNRQWPKAKG